MSTIVPPGSGSDQPELQLNERIAVALERIADALERGTTPISVIEFPNALTDIEVKEITEHYHRNITDTGAEVEG